MKLKQAAQSNVLIIYTGGTIGSFEDHVTKSLRPVDFEQLRSHIPELNKIDVNVSVVAFPVPRDSSDMQPGHWVEIVQVIEKNYDAYDGFVVLHGTDTMAYTASALSFMIENLSKPVIFTGSQLPIGMIRTDGKENLITAIEIAAAKKDGKAMVPEVCIYFEFKLYRANRTFKYSADHFHAYVSPNYPLLAEAGVNIVYNQAAITAPAEAPLRYCTELSDRVAVLTLFPGISEDVAAAVLGAANIKAVILHTFGFGNGPMQEWFFRLLREAIADGKVILNITQCKQGAVQQGRYETSRGMLEAGVTGGGDMTFEAAVAKCMYLLGKGLDAEALKQQLAMPLRGEISDVVPS